MHLKDGSSLQGGKYNIIRMLGQGGFGITYLAVHTLTEEKFAIKEFFPKTYCERDETTSQIKIGTRFNRELVDKLRRRFIKEAKNLRNTDHPGIVKVSDIFEENNTAYFAMDYIQGSSLSNIIRNEGALDESKALEYINQIGEALSYIHSKNMTHFDVKPGNIMIRKSDDKPILIDFGLSVQYTKEGDMTSTSIGAASPGFSAIEMYDVSKLSKFSPSTDVYSLGATLYALLTGSTPPNATDIIYSGLTIPNSVSNELAEVIKRAMLVGNDRTPTVSAFLDDLKRHNSIVEDGETEIQPLPIVPREPESEIPGQTNSQGTTIVHTEKLADPNLRFPKKFYEVNLGDRFDSPVLKTSSPGVVTYKSSNPDCAYVDKYTGQVIIQAKGTTYITAHIAETPNYKKGSTNYRLKVNPKDRGLAWSILIIIAIFTIIAFFVNRCSDGDRYYTGQGDLNLAEDGGDSAELVEDSAEFVLEEAPRAGSSDEDTPVDAPKELLR